MGFMNISQRPTEKGKFNPVDEYSDGWHYIDRADSTGLRHGCVYVSVRDDAGDWSFFMALHDLTCSMYLASRASHNVTHTGEAETCGIVAVPVTLKA